MDNRLIDKNYKTPLGIINCGLTSNKTSIETIDKKSYKNGQSEIYKTADYQVEIIQFKIRLPLYNGGNLTDSNGWIWRIIRINDTSEKIQIDCKLIDPIDNIDYYVATGEHLDAIEAGNNDWILHLGTEDGEMMNSRASNNNWFPNRLQNKKDLYLSFTEMKKTGFITKIPDLKIDERLHLQYICAYDKKSNDPENVNTWLAVDEFKNKLENWIGIDNE
ncbi:MAG: hypothetical protein H6586_08650 [Flavobacteriales bacterium]|nr:hypothetical protein [Flavobacteriales bacterium]